MVEGTETKEEVVVEATDAIGVTLEKKTAVAPGLAATPAAGVEEVMGEGIEMKEEVVGQATGAIGVTREREIAVSLGHAATPAAGRTGRPAGPGPGPRRCRWTGWQQEQTQHFQHLPPKS